MRAKIHQLGIGSSLQLNILKANYEYKSSSRNLVRFMPQLEVGLNETKTVSACLHPFCWWMLCSYYGFYLPFKLVVGLGGSYTQKVNKFQKIFCHGFWALILLQQVPYLIFGLREFQDDKKNSAYKYFYLVMNIFSLMRLLAFCWTVFMKQEEICDLISALSSPPPAFLNKPSKTPNWFKVGMAYLLYLCIFKTIISIIYITFFGAWLKDFKPPKKRFDVAIMRAREMLFLSNSTDSIKHPYTYENLILGTTELAVEATEVWNFNFQLIFYCGIIPFTFWFAAKEFEACISDIEKDVRGYDNNIKLQELVLQAFSNLKRISSSINLIWSKTIFLWLMEMSLLLIPFLNFGIATTNTFFVIQSFFNIISIAVALILYADGCRIVYDFRQWVISRDVAERIFTDKWQWERLLRELDDCPVGIGRPGVYIINYGFVAQLLVVFITLFAISFQ